MPNSEPRRCRTISEFHQFRELPKPKHPLISVINLEMANKFPVGEFQIIKDFYSIALKKDIDYKVQYGQNAFDFDEGVMFFMSPGQLLKLSFDKDRPSSQSGWMLLIHPDFLLNTPLAKNIKQYEYFNYSVNEALFLSDSEEALITGLVRQMEVEYNSNIDKFSQAVILAQVELLLTYADRFYQRQFITRKVPNHQVLGRLEDVINNYINSDALAKDGLPTVSYIAQALNMSPGYLSGLLKTLTGQSTQQLLHDKVMELAKVKLSTTHLSVSEIAYELGFEHPQSFSRLFKSKTNLSPLDFRNTFN